MNLKSWKMKKTKKKRKKGGRKMENKNITPEVEKTSKEDQKKRMETYAMKLKLLKEKKEHKK